MATERVKETGKRTGTRREYSRRRSGHDAMKRPPFCTRPVRAPATGPAGCRFAGARLGVLPSASVSLLPAPVPLARSFSGVVVLVVVAGVGSGWHSSSCSRRHVLESSSVSRSVSPGRRRHSTPVVCHVVPIRSHELVHCSLFAFAFDHELLVTDCYQVNSEQWGASQLASERRAPAVSWCRSSSSARRPARASR